MTMVLRLRLVCASALAFILATTIVYPAHPATQSRDGSEPKLVVILVADQMRADLASVRL